MKTIALLLAAFCSAQAAAPRLSQAKLDAMVKRWRHVLQLEDWTVDAVTIHLSEMPEGDAAYSITLEPLQMLHIFVLDPADYAELSKQGHAPVKTPRAILEDIENSVVHELVHLRVRGFRGATESTMANAEELLVDRLTTALLTKK
jgi:hypothetical protein